MQITIAGHLCLDIIPNWQTGTLADLRPGKIVNMDGVTFSTGGAVANTGIALKRLGFDPRLIARTGDDPVGKIIRSILRCEAINADSIAVSKGETSSYTVVLNPPDTDRSFLHYSGTNDSFTEQDIDFAAIRPGIFHFGYPPLMRQMYLEQGTRLENLLRKARSHGLLTSLDMALPDPNSQPGLLDWESILRRIMPDIDFFLPSLDELLYMIDKPVYEKMQRGALSLDTRLLDDLTNRLLDWGGNVVGIKLGEEGFYLRTSPKTGETLGAEWRSRQILAPIFVVQVQGTTGAGDTTIAGFLAAVSLGRKPEEVLTLANAVGASCVEAVSAVDGIPRLATVEQRIKDSWERVIPSILHGDWQVGDSGVFLGPLDRVR